MAEVEAKPESKPSGGGGGGGSKLVLILLAVNSLLLSAVLGLLVLKPGGAAKPGGGEKAEEHAQAEGHGGAEKGEKGKSGKEALPGPTLRLPDFVIHLRDGETERYARVSFEMEVADEKAKEAVTLRLPLIRDAFLTYLSDRNADELRGGDAIARLKGTLTQKLSELAPGTVRSLYITDLIVQ